MNQVYDRLVHLLVVSQDCVDINLVRRYVGLETAQQVAAVCARHRDSFTYVRKTGVVRLTQVTSTAGSAGTSVTNVPLLPSEPIEAHPDLQELGRCVQLCIDVFCQRDNSWLRYTELARVIDWPAKWPVISLRTCLPRLLASFSLFDHNFAGRRLRLSPKNYAQHGTALLFRNKLEALRTGLESDYKERQVVTLPDEPEPNGKIPSPERPAPAVECGTFFSLPDVFRLLSWQSRFEPHLGGFLDYVWRLPGVELGIRFRDGVPPPMLATACGERVVSEDSLKRYLASFLRQRDPPRAYVAEIRNGTQWASLGAGRLETFVSKHADWFELHHGTVTLLRKSEPEVPSVPIDGSFHNRRERADTDPESWLDEAEEEENEEPELQAARLPASRPPRRDKEPKGKLFRNVYREND
eukprot:TRINITY_DN1312_c0_g1_i2.p1 TRINITY_DN1312_c0_g1~~TRINITY_DN1312_c0_g1_i2.p1  ORF type:complete len:411 (-),score=36.36 TRINITY_DN1312_c0_g1_i2:34-1266(-)